MDIGGLGRRDGGGGAIGPGSSRGGGGSKRLLSIETFAFGTLFARVCPAGETVGGEDLGCGETFCNQLTLLGAPKDIEIPGLRLHPSAFHSGVVGRV